MIYSKEWYFAHKFCFILFVMICVPCCSKTSGRRNMFSRQLQYLSNIYHTTPNAVTLFGFSLCSSLIRRSKAAVYFRLSCVWTHARYHSMIYASLNTGIHRYFTVRILLPFPPATMFTTVKTIL